MSIVSLLREGHHIDTGDRRVRVPARLHLPGVISMLAVLNEVLNAEECAALIDMARPRNLFSREAEALLIEGFVTEALESIVDERLRESLAAAVRLWLVNTEKAQ